MPLRKDILHRAVIYEGDATRQGTASTKYRSEVHGSNRKIRPQKGTGSARLGNKKSPMLKGGGVAFGPKPRDFSTELPRKVYDQAWRTAISYRYKKGELILVDGEVDVDVAEESLERYVKDLLTWQNMGRSGGRTLFVTSERRHNLFDALDGENMGRHARALEAEEVDVKDMLEMGRVVIERDALEQLFIEHESDLPESQRIWSQLMVEHNGEDGVYIEV
jgi:large subunit ribosomal protein L4